MVAVFSLNIDQKSIALLVIMATESKPPFPPFTWETAQQKVKAAQAAWNTKYTQPVQELSFSVTS